MNIALVLAGGTGSRLGDSCPKQYLKVQGRPIIGYCLETLQNCTIIDRIWIVAEHEWENTILEAIKPVNDIQTGRNNLQKDGQEGGTKVLPCVMQGDKENKIWGFSFPGETRQLSIMNGMKDIKEMLLREGILREAGTELTESGQRREKVTLLVHDAARPMVSQSLIRRCYETLAGYDGVLPALPMKDTVYLSENGIGITSLLPREQLFAGQAPELFDFEQYDRACRSFSKEQLLKFNGSTEPAVLYGLKMAAIPGDEKNFKITTKEDLRRFERIMEL